MIPLQPLEVSKKPNPLNATHMILTNSTQTHTLICGSNEVYDNMVLTHSINTQCKHPSTKKIRCMIIYYKQVLTHSTVMQPVYDSDQLQ